MGRPKTPTPRASFANVRLTSEEREEIESTALTLGLKSISEYLRHLHKVHTNAAEQNRALNEVTPQAVYHGSGPQSGYSGIPVESDTHPTGFRALAHFTGDVLDLLEI